MKYCKKCDAIIIDDTIAKCPECGAQSSELAKIFQAQNFVYDDDAGAIIANNTSYSATEISDYAVVITNDKSKGLVIVLRDDTKIILDAGRPSLFKGYGETGKLIDIFEKKYVDLLCTANTSLREQIGHGRLPRTSPPPGIFLATGEYAIATAFKVIYSQQRARTTYHQSSSTAEGWTSGVLTPETNTYLAYLDTGSLVITNQRVIYAGHYHSFTFSISDILFLDRYRDGIGLNANTDQEMHIFRNIDGNLYADIIQVLISRKNTVSR